MQDRTLIAAILLVTVALIQITAFIMRMNGTVLIITSNILIGVLSYYFGVKRTPPVS